MSNSKKAKGGIFTEPASFGSPVVASSSERTKKKNNTTTEKRNSKRDRLKKKKARDSSASSEDGASSSVSQSSADSSESSFNSSVSSASSITSSGKKNKKKATAKEGGAQRPFSSANASSDAHKAIGSAAQGPPVQAIAAFSEAHPWKTTVMTIGVHGSLEELDAKKLEDGTIVRVLGDGIRIDKTVPNIHKRIEANCGIASQADVQRKPRNYIQPKDIVREVRVISAHNGFPCALHFRIPNLVASSAQHVYSAADGSPTNEVCFTLNSGEKLEDFVVCRNDVRPDDLKLLSDYKTFTPNNLQEGVMDIGEKDGIAYKSIPYTSEKPHPVVDLARRKILQEEMTKEQREKSKGAIPPELLSQSRDWPNRRIMAAHLWDKYLERTASGMKQTNPHSDVAHPVVLVSRIVDAPVYAKSGTTGSKSSKYEKISSQANWLHSSQVYTDRITPEAKASVLNTQRQAWIKVEIRSSETESLGTAL